MRSGAQKLTFSMVWSTIRPLVSSSTTRSPSPLTCSRPRIARRREFYTQQKTNDLNYTSFHAWTELYMESHPQHFERLLAHLHSARLEHLHASHVLDGKRASGRSHCLVVRLPLVRFGRFGDSIFPPAKRLAKRSTQAVHLLGWSLAEPERWSFL